MAVYKRTGLFELNLARGAAFSFERTVESGFCLGLYDIIGVIGFVYQYTQAIWSDFNHATANRKVVELTISVALRVANSNRAWRCYAHQWLVAREYRDLACSGWQNNFINIFVYFRAE